MEQTHPISVFDLRNEKLVWQRYRGNGRTVDDRGLAKPSPESVLAYLVADDRAERAERFSVARLARARSVLFS